MLLHPTAQHWKHWAQAWLSDSSLDASTGGHPCSFGERWGGTNGGRWLSWQALAPSVEAPFFCSHVKFSQCSCDLIKIRISPGFLGLRWCHEDLNIIVSWDQGKEDPCWRSMWDSRAWNLQLWLEKTLQTPHSKLVEKKEKTLETSDRMERWSTAGLWGAEETWPSKA